MNTTEEKKLIADTQAGDPFAFNTLYQCYAGRVFAFARQLSGSQTDAEDLTQEAFISAFQGLRRFRGQSALLTWLLGIVVRRWRDQRRRPMLPSADPGTFHADNLCDQTLTHIVLSKAIADLPVPIREAFLLVAVQGLTHREAAALLEQPLGTLKWRVAEAGRRLRASIQDSEPSPSEERFIPHVPQRHR